MTATQQPVFALDAEGYLTRSGVRFVPVGVNYWPGSCGVEMWRQWPKAEMQHDLDLVKSLGLNTVRFFLRWQDFEPQPGEYDVLIFRRLAQFLTWCRERGLYAHPSLFVGWMSGGIFSPDWCGNRNWFADPFMVERAAEFGRKATQAIAPYHESVLAIDQGNELCCLPDSSNAPPAAVIEWCRRVNEGIRRAYPQVLIVSGNEQAQLLGDTGWRLGNQPGTDFYSMHAYPVPNWHSIGFDGMTDPLCQSLLPFYTQVARAFGPVMVQEFGTICTFGQRQQDSYLRAILPACWRAGANGFLWWCLRDIHAAVQPYLNNGFEGTLGLVDAQDRIKPGLEYFIEFAHDVGRAVSPPPPLTTYSQAQADAIAMVSEQQAMGRNDDPSRSIVSRSQTAGRVDAPSLSTESHTHATGRANSPPYIGVYWPRQYYLRDNPVNPGNDPKRLARWLVIANYLLRQLSCEACIVRGDLPMDPSISTIVVPGALLGVDEAAMIGEWVRSGGKLIWHGPDPVNWGAAYINLLGARPVDYRASRPVQVNVFGQCWEMATYLHNMRTEVDPTTARVLATDGDGLPVVLQNTVGQGCVVYAIPVVEDAVAQVAHLREERDRWRLWYAGMLDIIHGGQP
jgi:hypothetical protein